MSVAMHSPGRVAPQMRLRTVAIILCAAVLAAGCAAGPDFKPPAPPRERNYTAERLAARTVSTPAALGNAQRFGAQTPTGALWWQRFDSAMLNALIEQALQSSPTLAAARATLREAEQTYAAQAGSVLYPQATGKLGAQRQTFSPSTQGLSGNGRTFNLYNASVNVSYNLDLSGGTRRTLEALAAQTDYQRIELDGARLTLEANVVTAAVTGAELSAQIAASERMLAAQSEMLTLTRRRLALGNASEIDVLSLRAQVEQTRAGIVPLRNRLQEFRHLLAVLLGRPPGEEAIPQITLADLTLPAELPLQVPSELVRRRPDILASEALLHVASAQYGVAVSRLSPQLTLTGNLGSQTLTSAALFGAHSMVWGVAGQLVQPLFNPGLRPAARASEAAFDAAAANYRQTVLLAVRDVADVLRALENDAQALQAESAADASAQRSLYLVSQQYRLGVATYLQLLIAQEQAQQARISLIAAQAQRLADTAALYQAMGGGSL